MAKIVAQGQLTIVDMHDMPPVQGRLTSNHPKVVVLSSNGSTQSPDWASSNLVVTAELYKAGNPNDLVSTGSAEITGITWYVTQTGSTETTTLPSGVTAGKTGTSIYNNKLTVNQRLLSTSKTGLKFRAVVNYRYSGTEQSVPVSMEIDFAIANNGIAGQDSYSGFLTNTSHVFPCDSSGNAAGAYTVKTSAMIYKGTSALSGSSITLVNKSGQALPTGMSVEPIDGETNAVNIKISSGASFGGADNGIIYLTASGEGKSFDLAFSWSKGKQGNAGIDSTSYWSIPSTNAIVKRWNGSSWTLDPASISVKAMRQVGSAQTAAYNTRFKIQLFNGSTPLTGSGNETTSTADEASRSLTPSASTTFTHAKITMYKAGGTSVVLDEEEIRLIAEPKKPIVVAVSADSDTIRNNSGTAVLRVKVYRDGEDISATATKKWMKGTSTTSLGTGETYTVQASDIASSEMFRCQVTVDGANYLDSIVIYDTSDPIQMVVNSSNGDVFKNGNGTTVLTCNLWRDGSSLDSAGTSYMYCWHKMNKDGTEDVNWSPTPVAASTLATASPSIAGVVSASGTTITLNDVTYVRKGYKVFFGSDATVYTVNSVNTSTKQIVIDKTPTTTVATNATVRVANYKQITVTDAHVDDKATFICELVQ